jgi:hypothetical protein
MNLYEPFMRWKHKRQPFQTRNINSEHLVSGKVAIFLVYQPKGLPASVWLTLTHLKSKGYSTLLVSNSPLSCEDSAKALPLCWQVMSRPNFGYDFGGYQDGVNAIWASGQSPRQLLILNDSIWFPLRRNCDFLERMEAEDVGFVGAFQLEPSRNPAKMQGKKRPFMGSFFWHIKEPVLSHTSFKDFWQHYKASSSKYATIRRGERRFTHHLLDAGVAVKGMYSRQQFDGWLDQANDIDMRNTLRELCVADPHLEGLRKRLLNQDLASPKGQAEVKDLVRTITASQNIMATAPLFMVRDHGLPFLKKSADETNLLALDKLCVYFEDNPDWIDSEVLQEMQAVVTAQWSV